MQTPAATDERSLPRHVVRLSDALAALLGRAEEGAELSEDGLLGGLRQQGLITYPPWTRAQGLRPPHRLLVRLSGALAEQLARPYFVTQVPFSAEL